MMTTGTVQFALQLDDERPSKHIAARGCGPLAQPKRSSFSKAKVPAAQLHRSSLRRPDDAGRSSALCRAQSFGRTARESQRAPKAPFSGDLSRGQRKSGKAFKGRRFGERPDRFEHAAAELALAVRPQPIPPEYGHARVAGALQTRRHCRQFKGRPQTDGRTIWLGPIDFSHPAAPIYLFGHGVHERCHVVHTNFDAAGSEAHSDPRGAHSSTSLKIFAWTHWAWRSAAATAFGVKHSLLCSARQGRRHLLSTEPPSPELFSAGCWASPRLRF